MEWYVDRARLWRLANTQPELTQRELADEVGRSLSWVKKWLRRFREISPDYDPAVLHGHSRAPKRPPERISQEVIERILEIRDDPPDGLQRVPGPLTIIYYLHQDEDLKVSGLRLPRSTRTVWRILDQYGRIWRKPKHAHVPVERPEPMAAWEMDFKDISTVPAQPNGKQAHVVEVLNVVDAGTSILLDARPREDYTMETTLLTVASTLLVNGLPHSVTIDRDARFVGRTYGYDFPLPLVRFLLCLGVNVKVTPPRRPDLKPSVERYNKTYEYECLRIHRPTDMGQTCEVTEAFKQHYNLERPNQAVTCGNQPPCVAFPSLPALPLVPEVVDPDRWLRAMDGVQFTRRVKRGGAVRVDFESYYIQQKLRGQQVVLEVDATAREFLVYHRKTLIKQLPIRGLIDRPMASQDYLKLLSDEARRRRRWRGRR